MASRVLGGVAGSATADPSQLTAALVDIPSESRNEARIADEIEAALRDRPRIRDRPQRQRRAGAHRAGPAVAGAAGRTLDTVPVAGNLPSRREDGQLHGCGTADMKPGDAVSLHLAATVAEPCAALVFYECEEINSAATVWAGSSASCLTGCRPTWQSWASPPGDTSRPAARARCGSCSAPPKLAGIRRVPGWPTTQFTSWARWSGRHLSEDQCWLWPAGPVSPVSPCVPVAPSPVLPGAPAPPSPPTPPPPPSPPNSPRRRGRRAYHHCRRCRPRRRQHRRRRPRPRRRPRCCPPGLPVRLHRPRRRHRRHRRCHRRRRHHRCPPV